MTAATAIAALQEAGGKLSRNMIDDGYEAFSYVVTLCIELIRQFYEMPRQFRLLGEMGREEFVSYDNMGLLPEAIDDGINVSYRVPVFDLEIAAQDENPYKTMEYNQLALQLFQLGFFREDMADQALRCLELMEFKNKDRMVSVITEGKTQAKMIARLQSQLMQVAQVVDEAKGTQLAAELAAEYAAVPMTKGTAGGAKNKMSAMDQMRQKTRQAVTPL